MENGLKESNLKTKLRACSIFFTQIWLLDIGKNKIKIKQKKKWKRWGKGTMGLLKPNDKRFAIWTFIFTVHTPLFLVFLIFSLDYPLNTFPSLISFFCVMVFGMCLPIESSAKHNSSIPKTPISQTSYQISNQLRVGFDIQIFYHLS